MHHCDTTKYVVIGMCRTVRYSMARAIGGGWGKDRGGGKGYMEEAAWLLR